MSGEEKGTVVPAPETTMESKETQHPELTVQSSSLLNELTSLPLFGTLGSFYTRLRDSHWALKSGLVMVEDACSTVLGKLHIGSEAAIKIDKAAGDGVTRLKQRYPSITAPTDEILETGKSNATFFFHKTIRKLFRTYPGQITLNLFDWSVDRADRLLRKVNPPIKSPRKRKVTRAVAKKMQKETADASEDSGACDTIEKLEKPSETVETSPWEPIPLMMMNKMFRRILVAPMDTTVSALKRVRKYLHAVSQKRRKPERAGNHSPEKEAEIEARRKVSPRKRKPMSLLDQVRRTAFGVLGYKDIKVKHLHMEKSDTELLSREEAERKRKHDEILTDQGSASEESNDDDLADFDLDNYESEDDPDYEPSDSDAISEDISDAETESDIECEKVGEPGFVQLKEKKEETPKEAKQLEQKPTKLDEKSADVLRETKSKDEKMPEKSEDKTKLPKEESKPQPTSKDKKTHKPGEKIEPPKEEKPKPSSPKDKKPGGKVEPPREETKQKQMAVPTDQKASIPGDTSVDPPKDAKMKQPMSEKLSESVMNGSSASEDKQPIKYGKFFNK